MSMSDPIADMLTRIRNANSAKHSTVDIPASNSRDQAFLFQQGQDAGQILLSDFQSPHQVPVGQMKHALKEHIVRGHPHGNSHLL